jgi:hypothetical protein
MSEYKCTNITSRLKLAILEHGLKYPQYEVWNTASLSNALNAIKGKYGSKGHNLGIQLCEGFLSWYIGKTFGLWEYVTSYVSSTETGNVKKEFPSSVEIRKQIDDAINEYNENHIESSDERNNFGNDE